MFRIQNNVPTYLINESRDFQLLCRIYDCVNNGVKFNTDSIVRVMDTLSCGSKFLKLLETRLGFFTSGNYTDDEIRDVLLGFCDAVRFKGSILGITRAVRLFLLAKNMKVGTSIEYNNDEKSLRIGFRTSVVDTSLLTDILRYITPAGCYLEYVFYVEKSYEDNLEYGERVTVIRSDDGVTFRVVSRGDEYTEESGYPTSGLTGLKKEAVDNSLSNIGLAGVYRKSNETVSWDVKTYGDYKDNNNG